MSQDIKFFIDKEPYKGSNGSDKFLDNVLFFQFRKKSKVIPNAYDFELVTRANEEHAKNYSGAWSDFKKLNPDYRASWEAETAPLPVVEEPVVEVSEPEVIEEVVEVVTPKRKSKKEKVQDEE